MSFEQMLRERIQQEADAVPLPMRDPDQAIDRSRVRRRRRARRTAATGLAVAIVAAVAVPPMLRGDDDQATVAAGGAAGLVPTGPLELDWRPADGGLTNVRASFQGDDGTVYALSTGPGTRYEDYPEGDIPRALYRLADDGSWEPVALDGERPRAIDAASGNGLLYAVSTGPASGGDGTTVRLSTSADGGDTWSSQEVEPVAPPSTVVPWGVNSWTAVESNGSTTLAVVTTSFHPDQLSLFPELDGDDAGDLGVETREEGLVLVRYPSVEVGPDGAATRPTTPPEAEPGPDPAVSEDEVERVAEAQVELDRGVVEDEPEPEVVRTVPWADLGVDGPEALDPRTRLFRWADGTWEPVDSATETLAGLAAPDLQVAGGQFVATGWSPAGDQTVALTSTDGASWAPVSVPGDGYLVGVGPALVQVPYEGTVLKVSGDGGATWNDVDLTDAGVDPNAMVISSDGGPLGLALVVVDADSGRPGELVVTGDLIDWTVTPLTDITSRDTVGEVTTMVGEDRIVVSASEALDGGSEPPASVTVVGTPVRTP